MHGTDPDSFAPRPRRRRRPDLNKADITPALVSRLLAAQFPHLAHLPVAPVELDGWDNTTLRLGAELAVRLPSADVYVPQVEKEHRWLPILAPQLPLPIPASSLCLFPNTGCTSAMSYS